MGLISIQSFLLLLISIFLFVDDLSLIFVTINHLNQCLKYSLNFDLSDDMLFISFYLRPFAGLLSIQVRSCVCLICLIILKIGQFFVKFLQISVFGLLAFTVVNDNKIIGSGSNDIYLYYHIDRRNSKAEIITQLSHFTNYLYNLSQKNITIRKK